MWQCYHKSITMRTILVARGMDVSLLCPVCNEAPESIIHALRDCRYVRTFWNSFPTPFQPNLFYETNMLDWLRLNCCSSCPYSHLNIDWGIIFNYGL
ncbi:hypothetical protein CFP56_016614 [Quercus suber]|uniref:Reverse transcriptase zinc-binding domain-containing protein n=1 Tax=Quercus suber TaxID=58331 RepID=A0AAW0KQ16_QUESU